MQMSDGSGVLEGNTLTQLSTLRTGGGLIKITLHKGSSGLSCSAVASHAREVGAGPTKDKTPSGENVYVLSMTPTAMGCRITR